MADRGALKTNLTLWPRSQRFLEMTGCLLPHKLPHKLWKPGKGQSTAQSEGFPECLESLLQHPLTSAHCPPPLPPSSQETHGPVLCLEPGNLLPQTGEGSAVRNRDPKYWWLKQRLFTHKNAEETSPGPVVWGLHRLLGSPGSFQLTAPSSLGHRPHPCDRRQDGGRGKDKGGKEEALTDFKEGFWVPRNNLCHTITSICKGCREVVLFFWDHIQ